MVLTGGTPGLDGAFGPLDVTAGAAVELAALGGAACCEPHAKRPAHPIQTAAVNRMVGADIDYRANTVEQSASKGAARRLR